MIIRHFPRCSRHVRIFLLLLTSFLLWLTGISDHLFETSFQHFKWPDYNVNLKAQALSALQSGKFTGKLLNDWNKLNRLMEPICSTASNTDNRNLLIIVKSALHNVKNRDAIRKTWGAEKANLDIDIRTLFILGRFKGAKEQLSMGIAIEREHELYNDLIVADLWDTYRNNTAKLIHSIGYSMYPSNNCPSADFVLLIDDDYMLSVHNLIRRIQNLDPEQPIYEGFVFETSPFRFIFHKHRVSLSDWPYDQYPRYVSAGAVLLSRRTLSLFYHSIPYVKQYSFDDVYTGILSHLLEINPIHNEGFVFWNRHIEQNEWESGKVIAAHGYSPQQIEELYHLVRLFGAG